MNIEQGRYELYQNTVHHVSDDKIVKTVAVAKEMKLNDPLSINCLFFLFYSRVELANMIFDALIEIIGREEMVKRLNTHHFYYAHTRSQAAAFLVGIGEAVPTTIKNTTG